MKKQLSKKFYALLLIIIGMFSATILNAQWLNKASAFTQPNRGINEIIAVNSSVAWAMAYDGTNPLSAPINEFTRTTDGGNHWKAGKIDAFPDYYLVSIAPLSTSLCYASIANFDNGNCKIVKTTDGGTTWTEQLNYDFGLSFGFFADIYFFNPNDGLIYGDQSNGYITIFTTHDGGANWTRVPQTNLPFALPDESSYVFSVEGLGNTFWTVSSAGRVWKTTDKGLHWSAYQTQETFIDYSNLKMRDALHGLWGVHDELYKTVDGGITWTEITLSGTWFTDDLAYVPGTASTYVSTGGHDFSGYGALHGIGTSYSLDDGNTWVIIDNNVEHVSLAMINSYTGLTGGFNINASTNGIFKYNGSALGYSCGNDLTSVCHKGQTICVENGSIANHLAKGDFLGACPAYSVTKNEILSEIQQSNKELKVYPNPASSSATILFSLNQSGKVSLKIFDIAGRLVKTLANEEMQQGNHEIKWSVNDEYGNRVPSGIYFLQFDAGTYSEIKKLSVAR